MHTYHKVALLTTSLVCISNAGIAQEHRDYKNDRYTLSAIACDTIRGGAHSLFKENPPNMKTHRYDKATYYVTTKPAFYKSKLAGAPTVTYIASSKKLPDNYRHEIGKALINSGDAGAPFVITLAGGLIPGFGSAVGSTLSLFDAWLKNGKGTKSASYLGNLMQDGRGNIKQVVTFFEKNKHHFVTRSYVYTTNIDKKDRHYLICSTTFPLEFE